MRVLAVIPARGGSQGIPRKNLHPLGGRPLLDHTIQPCKRAQRVTRLILSTEDSEIARVGHELGVEVPFVRPSSLASHTASSIDVVLHALRTLEQEEGEQYDATLLLQPTCPFRTAEDVDGALRLLMETGADSVISVMDVGAMHPARMKYVEDGRLIDPPFAEERENQPRQELRPMVIRNGAIYATRREALVAGSFKGTHSRAWHMPFERSVNIDSAEDLLLAEHLLTRRGSGPRGAG
jgi:CMP-N-acetylneuraminic acid synthetase